MTNSVLSHEINIMFICSLIDNLPAVCARISTDLQIVYCNMNMYHIPKYLIINQYH